MLDISEFWLFLFEGIYIKSRRNAMKIMIFHGIFPLRGHTTAVVDVPDFFLWMVALIRGAYFCKGMASQEYIYAYEAIFVVIA